MARITAGVATSHVPAIGAALDLDKTAEPYWQPVFAENVVPDYKEDAPEKESEFVPEMPMPTAACHHHANCGRK